MGQLEQSVFLDGLRELVGGLLELLGGPELLSAPVILQRFPAVLSDTLAVVMRGQSGSYSEAGPFSQIRRAKKRGAKAPVVPPKRGR